MPLVKNGEVVADRYTRLDDDAPIPAEGAILISAARFLADTTSFASRAGDVGVVWPNNRDVSELAPAFRDAIKGLAVDQISDPIRTEVGLHLVAVCGRRHSGPNLPPREEIEARLEDQQLAQISKRYLRDLRNSATIEVK